VKKNVIKMGAAAKWLAAKREGRQEMKLSLTEGSANLLKAMVIEPHMLNLALVGENFKHWRAHDNSGARQVVSLQKWLEQKVLEKAEPKGFVAPKDGWTGALPQVYVDRLKEIVKHYEPLGMMPTVTRDYLSLVDALDGKPLEDKATEELLDYKEA